MNDMNCSFLNDIEAFLVFRESLGYKRISYEAHLLKAGRHFAEHWPEQESMTKEMVMDFMDAQTKDISRKASVLRMFATYLCAIGKEAYIIPKDMYRTRMPDAPYIFTDEELSLLFRQIDHIGKKKEWIAEVAPVLFRLTYTCGLRPKEARELKSANINFETGEILIEHSKRNKDRTVVMSEDMLALCRKFDQAREVKGIQSDYFFASTEGEAYSGQTLQSLFVRCWRAAFPGKRTPEGHVRIYCLRHRFATAVIHMWINEGKDLRNKLPYLQAFMGHDRLDETVYYVHLLPENLIRSAGIDWDSFDGIIPEVSP